MTKEQWIQRRRQAQQQRDNLLINLGALNESIAVCEQMIEELAAVEPQEKAAEETPSDPGEMS